MQQRQRGSGWALETILCHYSLSLLLLMLLLLPLLSYTKQHRSHIVT